MTMQGRSSQGPSGLAGVWWGIGAVLCFGLASFWLFGVAGAQNDSTVGDASWARDHVTVLNSKGRFSGPGTWPPAPHEARSPLVRSARPVSTDRPDAVTRLESQARAQELLGDKYSLISSTHPASTEAGAAKGELDRSQLETVWFSRSTNQTVTVRSDAAGGRLLELSTVPANHMQPDLADDEDQLAIELARAFWVDSGESRAEDLEAFSIWALREDGRVYDVRMAYVSFHLTNETIAKAQVIR